MVKGFHGLASVDHSAAISVRKVSPAVILLTNDSTSRAPVVN